MNLTSFEKDPIEATLEFNRGNFYLQVDFKISSRGITGLLGSSGCGKTTLLRLLAGFEYRRGNFLRMGKTVWQDGSKWVPPDKRQIGFVFQEMNLFSHLSVGKNIEYGFRRTPREQRRILPGDLLKFLKLECLIDRKSGTLSGGEQQRVAIARSLASNPKLLLMDEPLSSLDLEAKEQILFYIRKIHQEYHIPIIYVTHSLDEVAQLTDHLMMMERGRIRISGTTESLFSSLDFSLSRQPNASVVINAKVDHYEAAYHLTCLHFDGGKVFLPGMMEVGRLVRLRLAARDVSLTLTAQSGSSILNLIAARVDEIREENRSQVMVRLIAEKTPILARITRKSADRLRLGRGKRVYAQIKSMAILP